MGCNKILLKFWLIDARELPKARGLGNIMHNSIVPHTGTQTVRKGDNCRKTRSVGVFLLRILG